jgi:hypothetical protein
LDILICRSGLQCFLTIHIEASLDFLQAIKIRIDTLMRKFGLERVRFHADGFRPGLKPGVAGCPDDRHAARIK